MLGFYLFMLTFKKKLKKNARNEINLMQEIEKLEHIQSKLFMRN